jgi:biotin operon repressor
MANKEWEPSNIFDIFGDELARRILVYANRRPVSAEELGDHLDASSPTIYRRLNALADYDLVGEELQVDDDGHHYRTFETALDQITFAVGDTGYTVDIQIEEGPADQFADFWSDLGSDSETTFMQSTGQDDTGRDHHHG